MYQNEELLKRLNLVSENYPSYFLSFKKQKTYHKRNNISSYLSYRKKSGLSVNHSPLATPRGLRIKLSVLQKNSTPRTASKFDLFCLPLKTNPISLKDLSPNATKIQIGRPNTNQMSKLSIPLRDYQRSPNSKFLNVKIPKVDSRYF